MTSKRTNSHDKDDENHHPSWLDPTKDEEIVAPLLLGSGNMNLQDPDNETDTDGDHDDDDDTDIETAESTTVSGGGGKSNDADYGSIKTTATPDSSKKNKKKKIDNLWPFGGRGGDKKKKNASKRNSKKRSNNNDAILDDDWPNVPVAHNAKTGRPIPPNRGWCLDFFYFIEGCATITCLSLLVSQILPLVMIPLNEIEPVDFLLKVYMCLFAILFMVRTH
jgi:hypothetical protein